MAKPAQKDTNETVGIVMGPPTSSTGWRHPQQGSLGACVEEETLKWLVPLTRRTPRVRR